MEKVYDTTIRELEISHKKAIRTDKWIQLSSKVQINIQKLAAFYSPVTNYQNEKETILFKIALKNKKIWINLTREVKNLYSENYKHWRKQLKKRNRSGSINHACG